ncbi:ubiquitin-like protein [Apiospora kogelbergensis]|uniref:ubiquitin-like protein n=1 Tax=Apiospora kogelbergensis TaxID=1337665 RepID=UPI00312E7832
MCSFLLPIPGVNSNDQRATQHPSEKDIVMKQLSITPIIEVSYQDRRHSFFKPDTWDEMFIKVSQLFSFDNDQISQLRILCNKNPVKENSSGLAMTQDDWDDVRDGSTIHFENRDHISQHLKRDRSVDAVAKPSSVEKSARIQVADPQEEKRVKITVTWAAHQSVNLKTKLSSRVVTLKKLFEDKKGLPPQKQKLLLDGRELLDDKCLHDYGITQGTEIKLECRLRRAKQSIYLLSPKTMDHMKEDDAMKHVDFWGRLRTWAVITASDGTIEDYETSLHDSYLYWEAESLPLPERAPSSKEADLTAFNPAAPHAFLRHAHEVLPFKDVFYARLDVILERLHLTVAMRTEFIVRWIPAFERIRDSGQHIKFSFVPQRAFSQAASMDIGTHPLGLTDSKRHSPPICRVFMLFSGVDPPWPTGRTWCLLTGSITLDISVRKWRIQIFSV